MKKRNLLAAIFFAAALWGGAIYAQSEGTYIDNVSTQDSSNMQNADLNLDQKAGKKSSNVALIVGIAVILVGATTIIIYRKKKK
jgi:LPXTG-motif cell wall-anchored protein